MLHTIFESSVYGVSKCLKSARMIELNQI